MNVAMFFIYIQSVEGQGKLSYQPRNKHKH